jgi:hypothetical protein
MPARPAVAETAVALARPAVAETAVALELAAPLL